MSWRKGVHSRTAYEDLCADSSASAIPINVETGIWRAAATATRFLNVTFRSPRSMAPTKVRWRSDASARDSWVCPICLRRARITRPKAIRSSSVLSSVPIECNLQANRLYVYTIYRARTDEPAIHPLGPQPRTLQWVRCSATECLVSAACGSPHSFGFTSIVFSLRYVTSPGAEPRGLWTYFFSV